MSDCVTFIFFLAPAIGIVRPPNIFLKKLAPLGAKLFPTVTIEGDIRSGDLSRLPDVRQSLLDDPLMHRKVSFGTGNVMLQMTNVMDNTKVPEIPKPVLFIHGTADMITE